MRTTTLLLIALALPPHLAGQEAPPPDFAAGELDRSRRCVPALEQLVDMDGRLAPLARRAERIRALNTAIAFEDAERAEPFQEGDPLETAVRDWFAADEALALGATPETRDAVAEERARGRQAIRERLVEELRSISGQSQEILGTAGNLEEAVRDCDGAILVRSAVLEACGDGGGTVCEEARRPPGERGRFRFVEEADDLWDVEELRPWTEPSRLRIAQDGGLAGARTAALARRGNLVFVMSVEPLLLERAELPAEQVAEFDENLTRLGFAFEDERFVMAPALALQFDVLGRIGGETHYLLHFGDLSNPEEDIIWSAEASGERLEAIFPAGEATLARLAQGEMVSLTAVSFPDETSSEGDAVFTLEINPVGQSRAVGALLSYMAGGQLATDLTALVPPEAPGDR